MTPTELRTARKALGLTQHGLAKELGMGKWGFQSVAKWEKGLLPIPEHRAITIRLLLREARLDHPARIA